MKNNIYLSVIIPAYNEEERLPKTLESIDLYLKQQNYNYEIIVVDDGSKDKTSIIVKELSKKISNLRIINNKENKGKGGVVRQGIMEAQGNFRLFMDADNSTPVDYVEKMWPLFNEGKDIVIGTRDSKDAKGAKQAVPQAFLKRLLGNIGNLIIQALAVPGIWDTQCGFKCFSQKAVNEIFPRLQINRWGFDIEILFLAKKLNLNIGIIPILWEDVEGSKVGIKGYIQSFKDLIKIRTNYYKGVYKLK